MDVAIVGVESLVVWAHVLWSWNALSRPHCACLGQPSVACSPYVFQCAIRLSMWRACTLSSTTLPLAFAHLCW